MMDGLTDLFADIPAEMPEELVQVLLSEPGVRIERIVSLGHASPEGFWYDQEGSEWVLLLKGAARLRFEGEVPIELQPGSFVNIRPAGGTGSNGSTPANQRSGWPCITEIALE